MDYLLVYTNEEGHTDGLYNCDDEEKEDLIAEFEHYGTFNGEEKSSLRIFELMEAFEA